METINTISKAQSNLFKLRALIETLYLTSIPGMKESILNASKAKNEEFFDKIDLDSKE